MPQFKHCSVTLTGEYIAGNYWHGEIAQTGIRVGIWPTTAQVAIDGIMPTRDCDIAFESVDNTEFLGTVGFKGTSGEWSPSDQVSVALAMYRWAGAVSAQQHNVFQWTGVKITPISPAGAIAASSTLFDFKTPILGKLSGGMPPQISVACGLRTNVPGRRGRGRMFIPAISQNAALSTGLLSSVAGAVYGEATRELVDEVDGVAPLWQYKVVVTSAKSSRYVLPTEVRVGDQFDTQRRRRNAKEEVYTVYP